MIITCEACGTSFKVRSNMIKETGSTVRCSKCQYLFIAYPPTAEPVTPIELLPDEKIETSIDETFGRETDEKIISDIFGEEESDEDMEAGPETGDELRDLEAEIDADMTALSQKIDEGLFDDAEMGLDILGDDTEEPEIFISDLEDDATSTLDLEDFEDTDTSTIELDDISAGQADDVIDLEVLVQDAGEEEVFLDDLESDTTIAKSGAETMAPEADEDIEDLFSLEQLESPDEGDEILFEDFEAAQEDETIIIEDFEIGKDDVAQSEFADFEDLETADEGEISSETVGVDDELDDENLETTAAGEEIGAVDVADIDFEAEGGVEAQLEEFEAEKQPEGEKPSVKTAATGKKEPEKEPPEETEAEFELEFDLELEETADVEKAGNAEDLGLDVDLDETVAFETGTGTKEFELDFESELDDMLAEEKTDDAEDLDLEFDLEEPSAVETTAETEEFELDLEEDVSPGMKTAGEMEEFDLDFEGEEPLAEFSTTDEEDIGLDLDLDAFDLDLENVEAEDIGEEDFDFDLEAEDFDLKTKTFEMDADEFSEEEEVAFDLDLDMPPEEKSVADEEDLVFDLDIEAEEKPGATDEEFELDFEEMLDESETAGTIEDWEEAEAAATTKTSEELDLTEIEDFLDFGEEETTEVLDEPVEKVVESESDILEMDMNLDFETVTAPEVEEETGEIEIDLETMIDEEIGMEKEVSLETTDERQRRITEEYRKEVVFDEEPEKETGKIIDDTALEADVTAVVPPAETVRDKRRLVKPILILVFLLLLSGVLIYAGIRFFGAPTEVPEIVDPTGKLRIEMVQNPEYAFVVNDSAGEFLVVTGHVTNRYEQPRSHIQVKATIYDAAGEIVATSGAYCGNTLSDSDLSGLDMETINRRLSNREGDANANVNVQPGGRVPFTVVFNNLPADIDEMTVEVVASAI